MASKVVMFCRQCNLETEHWDNRQNKRNPKAPDFKCSVCGKAVWPKPVGTPKKAPINPPKTADNNGMSKEDWADKEKREFKGKTIMYALETLKMSDTDLKGLTISEVENLIQMSAERYLGWIYRKTLSEEELKKEFNAQNMGFPNEGC